MRFTAAWGNDPAFTETIPFDPSSPYSASKAASDHFVKAWDKTFGLPVVVTNCSNNYGPFQFPEKLIPLMILNILDKKPLPVYGKGQNIRDWLYVPDHCDALVRAFEKGAAGHSFEQALSATIDWYLENMDWVRSLQAGSLAGMDQNLLRHGTIKKMCGFFIFCLAFFKILY